MTFAFLPGTREPKETEECKLFSVKVVHGGFSLNIILRYACIDDQ